MTGFDEITLPFSDTSYLAESIAGHGVDVLVLEPDDLRDRVDRQSQPGAGDDGMSGSQDQVARLLALLPYLLAHPGAKVRDVARLFRVSERQLVRDLHVLWFSGLPGLSMGDYIEVDMEAVEGAGVINVSNADYLERPLRLQGDEALAIIVALRALASMPGLTDRDAVDRALVKLEAAAGGSFDGAAAVAIEDSRDFGTAVADTVRQALAESRRLHMGYWVPGRDETTERDVDPMRLLAVQGRLYLEGWCRLASDVRLFRLDRIASVSILDVAAEVPPQARQRDLADGLFQPSPTDEVVTLELDPRARWVAEYYPCESVEELPGNRLRARLRTADRRWVVRLVLRHGGAVQVIAPDVLVEEVRAGAQAALAAIRDDHGNVIIPDCARPARLAQTGSARSDRTKRPQAVASSACGCG